MFSNSFLIRSHYQFELVILGDQLICHAEDDDILTSHMVHILKVNPRLWVSDQAIPAPSEILESQATFTLGGSGGEILSSSRSKLPVQIFFSKRDRYDMALCNTLKYISTSHAEITIWCRTDSYYKKCLKAIFYSIITVQYYSIFDFFICMYSYANKQWVLQKIPQPFVPEGQTVWQKNKRKNVKYWHLKF